MNLTLYKIKISEKNIRTAMYKVKVRQLTRPSPTPQKLNATSWGYNIIINFYIKGTRSVGFGTYKYVPRL